MFNIILSPEAQNFFKSKLTEDESISLRIKSSGCSGYRYDFKIEKSHSNYVTDSGIKFNIDEESKKLIGDTFVSLKKDGLNSKIVFENSMAYNQCGCGESFNIKKDKV